MASPRIFISYDYDNDKHYKNLLVAWDRNDLFDFTFYDASVDISVNSTNAAYIKRVIKGRIDSSTHFLCLIGERTWLSDWVSWEIDTAVELRKKLVAVKIDNSYTSPIEIVGVGASWSKSFTFLGIEASIYNS